MYKFKLKEIEVGDTEINRGKKTTVSAIDDETGAIEWDVADVADFTSVYKALSKAKTFLDTLEKEGKAKDDVVIDGFSEDIAKLFNAFRTHVRKNYPKEYERVSRLKEDLKVDVQLQPSKEEIQITIPGDFSNNKGESAVEDELTKQNMIFQSFKVKDIKLAESVNEDNRKHALLRVEPRNYEAMIDKLQDMNINHRRESDTVIKVYTDNLSDKALYNLTHDVYVDKFVLKESVNEGHGLDQVDLDYLQHIADKNPDDTKLEKIVKFLTKSNILVDKTKDLSKDKEVEEGEGIGYMTPKAFDKNKKSTGASDIYYYKLGFKPVPKTKPKGFEVKQLFEKTDRNEFQTKRIASFNEIGERLNRIYPLLSNAKDATAKYYNENPGSYAIVYSTDYIFELLDEVEEKLKKTEDK